MVTRMNMINVIASKENKIAKCNCWHFIEISLTSPLKSNSIVELYV